MDNEEQTTGNEQQKKGSTFGGIVVIGFAIFLYCISWSLAYDFIGYPRGGEYVWCFILSLIIFAVIVTILTAIKRAFKGD